MTAKTASATASSAWVGSKNMLLDMAVTRRVIGGRLAFGPVCNVLLVIEDFPLRTDDDGEG